MSDIERNWAGNYEYSTDRLHFPETIAQVQDMVRRCHKLRVLGSRHSFNGIADSAENLISLEKLNRVIEFNRDDASVTVSAGISYGELCQYLYDEGFALHNLASLPHISIVGACATGSHGSGVGNGNLATAVTAMEIITAEGEAMELSREQHGDSFYGTVIGIGGLGVVSKITLEIMPAFDMQQVVYQNLPLSHLEDNFDSIMSSAYSVSLFTDWQNDHLDQIWVKHRVTDDVPRDWPRAYYEATLATEDQHPIASHSAENCTRQMGVPGPWHKRLPHFRMEFTPSSGEELQSEYFVAREHAFEALLAIKQLRQHLAPLLLVSEVRTIAADNLWMSPCFRQDCVALHFTWKQDWPAVRKLLPIIEEALAPLNARAHWGKLFTMRPEQLQAAYEKLPDFQQLLQKYDPVGKFRNAFLDTYIFGAPN